MKRTFYHSLPFICILLGWTIVASQTQVASAQVLLDEVRFVGLQKTKSAYLKTFIQSKPGAPHDTTIQADDEQSLQNLQLFDRVSSRLIEADGKYVLQFELRERITRLPITNFGGITDNFWFQLGFTDFNWMGKGGHFGGFYQYYDRHSFKIFQLMPQAFGPDLGLSYTVGKQATREPAYLQNGTTDFDVDRWEASALLRYILRRDLHTQTHWFVEAGGGYLEEVYAPRDAQVYTGETHFKKYFLKSALTLRQLNYHNHQLWGMEEVLSLQYVRTIGFNDAFWKLLNEFKAYTRIGHRGNPAMRVRAGISSNDDTPFVPFVLDSYLNVRGSGNRVARGTSELTLNLEHRQTLYERNQWALQGVAFIDLSAWRPAGAPLVDMFLRDNVVSFGGGGIRLHLRRVYSFSLRMDYGISLANRNMRGFVLGVGQYF